MILTSQIVRMDAEGTIMQAKELNDSCILEK